MSAKFPELFKRNYARVFGYLYGSIHDVDRARGLATLVFVRAVGDPALVTMGELRLFEIAHEVLAAEAADAEPDSAQEQLDPEAQVFFAALRALPAADREVLALRYDAELSDAEIAQVLHRDETQVHGQLVRLVEHLSAEVSQAGRRPDDRRAG